MRDVLPRSAFDLNLAGRVLSPFTWASAYAPNETPDPFPCVLQLTRYDPGSAAYRYHSAANVSAGGGVSAFVRYGHENPYCDLRQFDGERHAHTVRELFACADVVHVHMDYDTLSNGVGAWPERGRQLLVRHYHGSEPRGTAPDKSFVQNDYDWNLDAVQIGARLYHLRYSPSMEWLPIPMPCADYAALARRTFVPIDQRAQKPGVFRLAHSPTHARIKGTIEVQTLVMMMQRRGLPIELVMIQGKSHEDALAIKATCDATFDSFWLGMQGSGLEAACMGQMVIAGDSEVREESVQHLGYCPYTFAGDVEELGAVLERAMLDPVWRASEAARVRAYVEQWHDYPSVGTRYWGILQRAFRERGYAAA